MATVVQAPVDLLEEVAVLDCLPRRIGTCKT